MSILAIIPARGGSKRIHRKNIKSFVGKPIISYSIEAALKTNIFKEVMVSTDDNEIATISKEYGANVPFLRSDINSDDYSSTTDVVIEVIEKYKSLNTIFEYVCLIYPTAPFVTSDKLKQGFELLKNKKFDSVFCVLKFGYPIQRSLKMEDGKISMLFPENVNKRSQDFIPTYHDCGQFYWMKTDSILTYKTVFTSNTGAIELSEMEVNDIDNEIDWQIAEFKFQYQNFQRRQ